MCYSVSQSWFKSNLRSIFEINCSSTLKAFRDKVVDPNTTLPLEKILDVRQGVIAGGNAKWKKRLESLALSDYGENFTVSEKELAKMPSVDQHFLRRLVDGDSVDEFVSNWESHRMYLVYDEKYLAAPRIPSVFEQKEKLILKAKAEFLQASIDFDNTYVTNDTYIARWQENAEYKPSIKYLLGLLNSKVLDLYYKIRHCEYVQGGWFVRYGIFFDELPVKKANPAQEKEVVRIVNELIKARQKVIEAEKALSSRTKAIVAGNINVTTAGLSTIIDLKSRQGGEESIARLSIRGSTIYFNKQKTCSIKCISTLIAESVFGILKENFDSLENRTLNEVMSSLKLPSNEIEIQKFNNYIKTQEQAVNRQEKRIEKLKSELDEKIAEIYGVKEHFDLVCNSLKVIAGKIQET